MGKFLLRAARFLATRIWKVVNSWLASIGIFHGVHIEQLSPLVVPELVITEARDAVETSEVQSEPEIFTMHTPETMTITPESQGDSETTTIYTHTIAESLESRGESETAPPTPVDQHDPEESNLGSEEIPTPVPEEPDPVTQYCFLIALSEVKKAEYEESRDQSALDAAIKLGEAALELIPGDMSVHRAVLEEADADLAELMDDVDMVDFVAGLSELRKIRYVQSGDLADLEAAIEHSKVAAPETPKDHHCRANRLSGLGLLHKTRYERLGVLSDLDAAIENDEAALAAIPNNHAERVMILYGLSIRFNTRFERLGALTDLEAAIKYAEAALEETTAGDPNHVVMLRNVIDRLDNRYERLGALSDLEAAIKHTEAIVAATPEEHPDHTTRLNSLSIRLHGRYARLGVLSDLEAAIEHAEAAVATGDVSNRPRGLNNLGTLLLDRYSRSQALSDLGTAIDYVKAALETTTADHPNYADILHTLSIITATWYDKFGVTSDLETAIKHAEEALAATQREGSFHIARLDNLSTLLTTRYRRFGELDDLEAAIKHAEAALEAIPDGHINRAMSLFTLSTYLRARYDRTGDLDDLNAAIKYDEVALAITPGDHFDHAKILTNLSIYLGVRFERLGELSDLGTATEHAQAALAATPPDHLYRPLILNILSNCLYNRYDKLGTVNDLEEAIKHAESALEITPMDHPDHVARLGHLSKGLFVRYQRLGALSDLEAAIEHCEVALATTPEDHPERVLRLQNLSTYLSTRYRRLKVLGDLETGIRYAQTALAATPEDHPRRPVLLRETSQLLDTRSARLNIPGDLETALTYSKAALDAIPSDDFSRPLYLNTLGNCLLARYRRSNDMSDLDKAIEHVQAALEVTPVGHPNRSDVLFNLGNYFGSKYEKTGFEEDRERSFQSYLGSWNCHLAPPLRRVQAVQSAIEFFSTYQTWEESSSLLEDAVNMIPSISPRSLEREDQQELLSKLYRLSSDAASFALQAGKDASHALALLELGRGIITGFLIDYRTDLSDLKETHRSLFDSFTQLRAEINSSLESETSIDHSKTHTLPRRKQAMEEIELTLSNIRKIPAYKEFLLPPTPENLMKMARYGTIVVVNTTSLRSDAIIVTTSAIKALRLPKLVYAEAKRQMRKMANELVEGTLRNAAARNAKMNKLLLWLWNVAVEPVLNELEMHETINGTKLPRIWWIGTGELSMAPFHAAGDHSRRAGSSRNTFNRVVSSYIPTIKALSFARQQELNLASKPDAQLLLVTMPTTPGQPALRLAEKEADTLAAIVGKEATRTAPNGAPDKKTRATVLRQPSAANVLERLHQYDAVHFACHGVSDSSDPSNSSLLLLSGGAIDRLTVQEISRAHPKVAQLAYLSACFTANNPAADLADETIPLSSAFQLAGFNHVLATMWQSKDEACMGVAADFYSSLFDGQVVDSETDDGHGKVSTALHGAVKRLRDKRPDKPLVWAPFIHTGA